MAEWLGAGLQNLSQWFDSATHLQQMPLMYVRGFFCGTCLTEAFVCLRQTHPTAALRLRSPRYQARVLRASRQVRTPKKLSCLNQRRYAELDSASFTLTKVTAAARRAIRSPPQWRAVADEPRIANLRHLSSSITLWQRISFRNIELPYPKMNQRRNNVLP